MEGIVAVADSARAASGKALGTAGPVAFSAFLSHRYKSPVVNTFFFSIFNKSANVQFSVDKGDLPTNVTRLEKMMRQADCFVGIYPLPSEDPEWVSRAQLVDASKYFRLELGLAARANIPGIVFVDRRYAAVIGTPPSMIGFRYDWQQVRDGGMALMAADIERAFGLFCERMTSALALKREQSGREMRRTRVGILVPAAPYRGRGRYTDAQVEIIKEVVSSTGLLPELLPWPPIVDAALEEKLEQFDWMVVDIGEVVAATGIVGYLHGRFIPTLRIMRQHEGGSKVSALAQSLYGAHEVGYPKDILRWVDEPSLRRGLAARISNILYERVRISTAAEANAYFSSAGLRGEKIFVSYSGKDEAVAKPIVEALKKRFKTVFDYKDAGESIPAGTRWLEQIFASLDVADIAVPLLSKSYYASGNCVHEAEYMVAAKDAGRDKPGLFPVRLYRDDAMPPQWLSSIQSARLWDYDGVDRLVDAISGRLKG